MYEFWGPHPATEVITVMPNAELRDAVSLQSRVLAKVSMSGVQYTNVKKQPDQELYRWQFDCTRVKALEFWEFVKLYIGEKVKVVDHDGNVLVGYFRINPLQLNINKRAVICSSKEAVAIEVEFLRTE